MSGQDPFSQGWALRLSPAGGKVQQVVEGPASVRRQW